MKRGAGEREWGKEGEKEGSGVQATTITTKIQRQHMTHMSTPWPIFSSPPPAPPWPPNAGPRMVPAVLHYNKPLPTTHKTHTQADESVAMSAIRSTPYAASYTCRHSARAVVCTAGASCARSGAHSSANRPRIRTHQAAAAPLAGFMPSPRQDRGDSACGCLSAQ